MVERGWGFVDFIRKPYRRDELLQVIHHHLQLNWQSRGEQPTSPTSKTHNCGEIFVPAQIAPLVIQLTEAIELGDIIEVQQLAKTFLNEGKIVDSNLCTRQKSEPPEFSYSGQTC